MKLFVSVAVLCSVLAPRYGAEAAKILAIFPMPSTSHYILGHAFMLGLAERGHDVTMISPFQNKEPLKNGTYRDVVLTGINEMLEERKKDMKLNFFELTEWNPFLMTIFANYMVTQVTEATLQHENLQRLLHSGEQFDAVVVEQFFNDAHKALAAHFGAPLVLFITTGDTSWVAHMVKSPSPSSYVPASFAGPGSKGMTFWERATNVAMYAHIFALRHLYVQPAHSRIIKESFPNPPELGDVLHNVSLVLLNAHSSLNQAVPHVPGMIDIGGFHVKPPQKLPKDLQEFLDNSTEGVIYFSMGSHLKSVDMHAEKREAFLKAFAKLQQKVLWKWEDDTLPGQPPNLKLAKWLPQQDILAHPNVKLFITHGGFLSITETVYHGVPVLAIPIAGDQRTNAKMAVDGGFGLSLNYPDLTEELLTLTFEELLANPKYTNNAKARSRQFHDRPMSGMDTGAYWVEYVIRNNGAPHLRVAGLYLPWYQYHLLDVAALYIAVGLALLYVNFVVIRAVLRVLCRRFRRASQAKDDKTKKRQ